MASASTSPSTHKHEKRKTDGMPKLKSVVPMTDRRTDARTDGRTNGRTDGWTDGWMDGDGDGDADRDGDGDGDGWMDAWTSFSKAGPTSQQPNMAK